MFLLILKYFKKFSYFNKKGVTLETLIKFNRLKQLSTDFQFIIDSLKKSESNLLEVNF